MTKNLLNILKLTILILALIFTFLLTFYPHFSYSFPFHIDEWHHISEAEKLLNGEYSFGSLSSLEFGYHSFLAGIFLIGKFFGAEPILAYKFLPAFFVTISTLVLFLFLRKINYWIGIFAILFFASLPTNSNLLGIIFAVPLTLAIPLMYFLFFRFNEDDRMNTKKFYIIILVTFLALLFIHPISALFGFVVLLLYSAVSKEKRSRNLTAIFAIFLLLVPILVIYAYKLGLKSLLPIFAHGWTPFEPTLAPATSLLGKTWLAHPHLLPVLFGVVPFLLALLGIFYFFKESEKLRIFRLFIISVLISAFSIFLFMNFKFSVIAPFQRMLYYNMLSLIPFSAFGMIRFIEVFRRKKRRVILIASIILLILIFTFYNHYKTPKSLEIYELITEEDYAMLKFLGNESVGRRCIVMAPLKIAPAVYPITGNEVVSRIYFYKIPEKKKDVNIFYSSNCSGKKSIIKKYDMRFVISKEEIKCEDLKPIYAHRNNYIYETPR